MYGEVVTTRDRMTEVNMIRGLKYTYRYDSQFLGLRGGGGG